MYFFMWYISPVTCHYHQQPQSQTLLLLNSSLWTVGWFTKTQKPHVDKKKSLNLNIYIFKKWISPRGGGSDNVDEVILINF